MPLPTLGKQILQPVELALPNPPVVCAAEHTNHSPIHPPRPPMRNHSILLFKGFVVRACDGSILDASGVNSRRCYLAWLEIQGHSGSCAAQAALVVLPPHVNIGRTGFRSRGFHEKRISTPPPTPRLVDEPLVEVTVREEEEQSSENKLSLAVKRLAAAFPKFDVLGWKAVAGLARLTILATTPICSKPSPDVNYAEELCLRASLARPGCGVAVLDMTTAKLQKSSLCQNLNSLVCLGDLSTETGRELVHEDDLDKTSLAFGRAFYSPGIEVPVTGVRCFNTWGELVVVDCLFCVDPQSYLLVSSTSRVG
ncbi:hypothetical protein BASA81_013282 [Batrachochytrium salamandrivorans]|nr:hypothetical protein BASA81_013282 [Batrachochytrium salamandrivorans]